MKKSKLELLSGVFVLLGLAAIAYLTVKLGSGEFISGDSYLIEARFANAGGLSEGSTVLLAGVQVGRVEDIRMDPADYSAIATMRVVNAVKLPTDTMASIKTTGLIGDKYVALAPGADDTQLAPGARITMTESAVDLESLIGKMAFGKVKDEAPADSSEQTSP
ncbi:MAG: outer membrane lipid asymmetry maintenance protein MlaD [Chthoniobacterales bacterium]